MDRKKRVTYLDLAKAAGVVLMVVGHMIGALQSIDYKEGMPAVYRYISSFHMPLFFVISGVLFYLTGEERREIGAVIRRRAKTLLLPYASFSMVYLTRSLCGYFFYPELTELSGLWKLAVYAVTFRGISVLWFLPALFLGELFFLWCRKRLDDGRLIGLFLLLGFLLMYVSPVLRWEGWEEGPVLLFLEAVLHTGMRGLLAGLFLMIGYLAAPLLAAREKWSPAELLAGSLMLAALAPLSRLNGPVDFNYMVFSNSFLYMLCALDGIFGVLLVCKNLPPCRPLLWIGTNSLVIMATHMEFNILLYSIQWSFLINQFVTRAKVWALYATMAAIILLLEIPVVFMYNHYLYALIGKEKPKKGGQEE